MKTCLAVAAMLVANLLPSSGWAQSDAAAEQQLLKRIYEMRMRLERDRQYAENEARANVQLVTRGQAGRPDNPTVRQMRQDMNGQLARFEQSLRCLDVDVENNGGNTVVICGGNSGDISGENTTAGRDLVIPREGTQ